MRTGIRLKPKSSTIWKSKASWQCIGGLEIYFRSHIEARVASHLETLKKCLQINSWEHEPKTFWFLEIKRGVRSYKPDFKVTRLDGSHYWIEVKGYMDAKSKTKIKRFKKYYPEEQLYVVTKDKYFNLEQQIDGKIKFND